MWGVRFWRLRNPTICVKVSPMDQELKDKMDKILALVEENNAIIHKVHKSQKTAQMLKAIYWVIVIMVAAGGFYFIQPYLKTLGGLYGGFDSASSTIQQLIGELKK